jgi:hypothetical protein
MQKREYFGFTNPSAAVALDEHHFIVADDEVNRLCIYRIAIVSGPIQVVILKDLFNSLDSGENGELDLEGACRLGNIYFWIGSHSTSRKGKPRPARHCLFALEIVRSDSGLFNIKPIGEIYTHLVDELIKDCRFTRYALTTARTIPPKKIGGLSIEGLAATPEGGLLIGFRNPLTQGTIQHKRLMKGKALLIKLKNPFEILEGRSACFDDPIELDLKGFGIRDIVWRIKHRYLIVAGPYHDNQPTQHFKRKKFQLYSWSEKSQKLKRFKRTPLKNLNIEAALIYPESSDSVQLLSDDGVLVKSVGFRSLFLNLQQPGY